jgi:hypothetical protein
MSPIIIKIPPTPQGNKDPANPTANTILLITEIDLYLWKQEHAKAHDCKDEYSKNIAKTYIIVYHQCSPTLKNDLKASKKFAAIHSNQNVIALLKLVQSLCYSYDAKTQGVMATVASHKHLFMHYQKMELTTTPILTNSLLMSRQSKPTVALEQWGWCQLSLQASLRSCLILVPMMMPRTLQMPNVPLLFPLYVKNISLPSCSAMLTKKASGIFGLT